MLAPQKIRLLITNMLTVSVPILLVETVRGSALSVFINVRFKKKLRDRLELLQTARGIFHMLQSLCDSVALELPNLLPAPISVPCTPPSKHTCYTFVLYICRVWAHSVNSLKDVISLGYKKEKG